MRQWCGGCFVVGYQTGFIDRLAARCAVYIIATRCALRIAPVADRWLPVRFINTHAVCCVALLPVLVAVAILVRWLAVPRIPTTLDSVDKAQLLALLVIRCVLGDIRCYFRLIRIILWEFGRHFNGTVPLSDSRCVYSCAILLLMSLVQLLWQKY